MFAQSDDESSGVGNGAADDISNGITATFRKGGSAISGETVDIEHRGSPDHQLAGHRSRVIVMSADVSGSVKLDRRRCRLLGRVYGRLALRSFPSDQPHLQWLEGERDFQRHGGAKSLVRPCGDLCFGLDRRCGQSARRRIGQSLMLGAWISCLGGASTFAHSPMSFRP
jgi:hypothetical protein